MSRVTDILLIVSLEDAGIAPLQEALWRKCGFKLNNVSFHAGGNKYMQREVWAAAVNYLDPAIVAAEVGKVSWEWPESVQMLVAEDEDEAMSLVDLKERQR